MKTLSLRTTLRSLALASLLVPAVAGAEPHGDDHATEAHDDHATEAHDDHGAAAHGDDHGAEAHGDDHGEGHGDGHHGLAYTGDTDGDGTANWLDSDDEHYMLTTILFHVINFSLLVGLIVWGAKGSVKSFLHRRKLDIEDGITEAARLRKEAAERHDAVTARLAKLEDEIAGIHSRAQAEAEAEAERIRTQAAATAKSLVETAERQIRDEAKRASQALKAEAVELGVELATGILRNQLQAGDQRRLAEEFLASVNEGEAHG